MKSYNSDRHLNNRVHNTIAKFHYYNINILLLQYNSVMLYEVRLLLFIEFTQKDY